MSYQDRYDIFRELPFGRTASPRVSAYGVCIKSGKMLLIRTTSDDLWEVPGGGVEVGEEIFGALRREFLEEAGSVIVRCEPHPFTVVRLGTYDNARDRYHDAERYYYKIEEIQQQSGALHDPEVVAIDWVPVDALTLATVHAVHWPVAKQCIFHIY